jgi:hypothetical protein
MLPIVAEISHGVQQYLCNFLCSMPMTPRSALDSMHQQLQFFRTQADTDSIPSGPSKGAFLQTFCADPETGSVPIDNADSVAEFISEKKQMTAQNILVENRLDKGIQAVEAESHIYRGKSDENTSGRREAQHGPPRSSRIKLWMGSSSRQRIISPEGVITSIAHVGVADASGAANLIS